MTSIAPYKKRTLINTPERRKARNDYKLAKASSPKNKPKLISPYQKHLKSAKSKVTSLARKALSNWDS